MIEVGMDIKQRIARQFSRAASHYDAAAIVQADIAFDALEFVPQGVQRILDIGCGTGRVTLALNEKAANVFAMDLAEGMLTYAKSSTSNPVHWVAGDAEALPFQNNTFDCVFSTMALQWCENIDGVFGELHRVLEPGGKAVLAIMSQGSFRELNHSWKLLDVRPHTNQFVSEATLKTAAIQAGFKAETQSRDYLTMHDNVRCLLGTIKSIGANVVTSPGAQKILKRSTLQDLQRVYQAHHGLNGQLPLTYEVVLVQLHKPQMEGKGKA